MSAVVIVPLSITDDHRHRAWRHLHDRLINDGWPVVASDFSFDTKPWCKAEAVADALARAPGRDDDVLIIHDADVLADPAALRAAVAVIESGEVEWAIPHRRVLRLSAVASACWYDGVQVIELVRPAYIGMPGGGIVVLRRATYHDCPLDRRFVGWGDEDQSWGWALRTLHGEPWRHDSDVVHLWHPPQPSSLGQHSSSVVSNRLRRAYRAYQDDPVRMRALVDGGR